VRKVLYFGLILFNLHFATASFQIEEIPEELKKHYLIVINNLLYKDDYMTYEDIISKFLVEVDFDCQEEQQIIAHYAKKACHDDLEPQQLKSLNSYLKDPSAPDNRNYFAHLLAIHFGFENVINYHIYKWQKDLLQSRYN